MEREPAIARGKESAGVHVESLVRLVERKNEKQLLRYSELRNSGKGEQNSARARMTAMHRALSRKQRRTSTRV